MTPRASIRDDPAPMADDVEGPVALLAVLSPRRAVLRFRALFAVPRLRSSWRRSETYGPFRPRDGFGGVLLSEDFW
jgi:hypothetical protein